jgi:hypothetical protein
LARGAAIEEGRSPAEPRPANLGALGDKGLFCRVLIASLLTSPCVIRLLVVRRAHP